MTKRKNPNPIAKTFSLGMNGQRVIPNKKKGYEPHEMVESEDNQWYPGMFDGDLN